MAAHWDNDPLFEGVFVWAWDVYGPAKGTSEFSNQLAYYWPDLQTMLQNLKGAFKHTNAGMQVAFGPIGAANLTQWMVQSGLAIGSSDTAGASAWTPSSSFAMPFAPTSAGTTSTTIMGSSWLSNPGGTADATASLLAAFSDGETRTVNFALGSNVVSWTGGLTNAVGAGVTIAAAPGMLSQGVQTWMNLGGPGNNNWAPISPAPFTYTHAMFDVQGADITSGWYPFGGFSISDIINAANSKYNISHLFVVHLVPATGVPAAAVWTGSGGVASVLATSSLINTSYPSIYSTDP